MAEATGESHNDLMRGQAQASLRSGHRRAIRPSGPIALVAAAILVIGLTTYLSTTRIRTSLPAAVEIPRPGPGPGGSGSTGFSRAGGLPVSDPVSAGSGATTSTTLPPSRPVPVAPQYPLHQLTTPGDNPAGAGSPLPDAKSSPAVTTTTEPETENAPEPGGSDDGALPVSPDYPVVNPPAGTTTTTITTSTTSSGPTTTSNTDR